MEQLTITSDKRAVTESGAVGVVMRMASGSGVDDDGVKFRYFDYKTSFFQPATRVEWDTAGMEAVLPADIAGFLISKGYARGMTGSEVRNYNRALGFEEKTKEPDPPSTAKSDPPTPPVQETATPVKEEAASTEKETKQTSKPKKGDSK